MNVTTCNLTYLMLAWERSTYDNIILLQEIKEKEVFYDARMKALRGLKATNVLSGTSHNTHLNIFKTNLQR
jgi:hypothetical protein